MLADLLIQILGAVPVGLSTLANTGSAQENLSLSAQLNI